MLKLGCNEIAERSWGGFMPKLYTLDAMRWVAAMMVAALHFGMFAESTLSPNLAVDFFFALSGFVIAYAYDSKLSHGMTGEEFLRRRLIRLYPLFFVGISLGLVVTLAGSLHPQFTDNDGPYLVQYLTALVFLPWPSNATVDMAEASVSPLNGPYWSLILEIHINLLFAIFFRWLGLRLLSILVALFGLGLIATAWYEGSLTTGYQMQTFHFGIVRVGFSFLVGVLICRLRDRIWVPRLHWAAAIALLGVLLVLPTPEAGRWIYDAVCVLVLFPILILAGAVSQPRGDKLVAVFGRMGGASYALYAIHVPIVAVAQFLAETNPSIPYRVWSLPFMFAAIVLAFVLDRVFDVPFRRWLTARLLSRRAAPAAGAKALTQAAPP
jgi:peptidoglycan/LPS O-acetylase OafA/YrhL